MATEVESRAEKLWGEPGWTIFEMGNGGLVKGEGKNAFIYGLCGCEAVALTGIQEQIPFAAITHYPETQRVQYLHKLEALGKQIGDANEVEASIFVPGTYRQTDGSWHHVPIDPEQAKLLEMMVGMTIPNAKIKVELYSMDSMEKFGGKSAPKAIIVKASSDSNTNKVLKWF